jgi:hypothetical protein
LLALSLQLALGGTIPRENLLAAETVDLAAASICHGDASGQQKPAPHHGPTCADCLPCHRVALAASLLIPSLTQLSLPTPGPALCFASPPVRAPPARTVASAYPRGPPSPI